MTHDRGTIVNKLIEFIANQLTEFNINAKR